MTDELRELDAEIAEKVMGWTIVPEGERWRVSRTGEYANSWCVDSPNLAELDDDTDDRLYGRYAMPSYSSDISAAMSVVEKMRSQGWSFACTLYEGKLPYASFCKRTAASSRNAEAESLSEAICRAALKTVVETEE